MNLTFYWRLGGLARNEKENIQLVEKTKQDWGTGSEGNRGVCHFQMRCLGRSTWENGVTGGPSSLRLNFYYLENWIRDFPGSQWLRIHLEMRGTPVLYLV